MMVAIGLGLLWFWAAANKQHPQQGRRLSVGRAAEHPKANGYLK
jgi:hypothetical protein